MKNQSLHDKSQTYTGRMVSLLDPKPEDICIEDVAHHLAIVNRFGGATREPYSVAQHAVLVSIYVENSLQSGDNPRSITWRIGRHPFYCEQITHYTLSEAMQVGGAAKLPPRCARAVRGALCHDNTEYLLGDIRRPIKYQPSFEGYRAIEAHTDAVICQALDCAIPEEHAALVHEADNVLLATEWRDLMMVGTDVNWGSVSYAPAVEKIVPWSWQEAERLFLLRWKQVAP